MRFATLAAFVFCSVLGGCAIEDSIDEPVLGEEQQESMACFDYCDRNFDEERDYCYDQGSPVSDCLMRAYRWRWDCYDYCSALPY